MLEQRAAAACARVDDDARLVDRGRAGRRDVHEVDRFAEFTACRDPDEDAACRERIGEQRIAVVCLVARPAQERVRRLRVALDQGREVDDLEARGRGWRRECCRVAAIHQHDAVCARNFKEPRVDRNADRGCGGRLGIERVLADARVVEVLPVFVAAIGEPARDERAERRVPPARPGGTAGEPGREPGMCRGNALHGLRARSCGRRTLLQPVVAAAFELERKLASAALDDAAAREHVHAVRHDVVEEPLVVGHEHDGAPGSRASH